jgi:hypothetical protein
VPGGVSSLDVSVIGAPGGNGASQDSSGQGGEGADVTNLALAVQAGATLYVDIGARGANNSDDEALCPSNAAGGSRDGGAGGSGCGNGFGGGGGGGSSDLSKEPLTGAGATTPTGNAQDPRLIVAGGGGGGGGESDYDGGSGGNAGGSGTGPGGGGCSGNAANGGTGSGGGTGGAQGGGGGGGAGSSYLGTEVAGAPSAPTVTTAGSQAPSVSISWSVVSLVFSGKHAIDIIGSIVSGGLKITSVRGRLFSVTGQPVIQTASGQTFRVSVHIYRFFGSLTGQISVSGPGVHTTAFVNPRTLQVSDGVLTGRGSGRIGFSSYTLSFTL